MIIILFLLNHSISTLCPPPCHLVSPLMFPSLLLPFSSRVSALSNDFNAIAWMSFVQNLLTIFRNIYSPSSLVPWCFLHSCPLLHNFILPLLLFHSIFTISCFVSSSPVVLPFNIHYYIFCLLMLVRSLFPILSGPIIRYLVSPISQSLRYYSVPYIF